MSKFKALLIAFAVTSTVSACRTANSNSDILSGVQEGNGGDAVVCKAADSSIISVESFDLYEADALRGILPDLGAPDLDPVVKLEAALLRLSRLDAKRAEDYLKKAQLFMANSRPVADFILNDIPDSNHIGLKTGCTLEQLVAHIPPKFPQDKPYIVSKDLWEHLTNDHKAAVILHEIVYRELKEAGATDSVNARYFNSVILSNLTENMNHAEYITILKLIDPAQTLKYSSKLVADSTIEDYEISGDQIELTINQQVFTRIGPHSLKVRNLTFTNQLELVLDSGVDIRGGTLNVLGSTCDTTQSRVDFFPSTFVPTGYHRCEINFKLGEQELSAHQILLDSAGLLTEATIKNYAPFKVAGDRIFNIVSTYDPPMKIPGEIISHYTTKFYPNGMLRSAAFDSRATSNCFLKPSGDELCLPNRYSAYEVSFDENGYLTEAK